MRFAHSGEVEQDSPTQAQLEAFGKVDVAFAQFANSYSSINILIKQ
jgi:hypothetical protein